MRGEHRLRRIRRHARTWWLGVRRRNEPGRLTLYLGAVSGCGKTMAMLADAQRAATADGGVVLADVAHHGRTATAQAIAGSSLARTTLLEAVRDPAALRAKGVRLVVADELYGSLEPAWPGTRWMAVRALLADGFDVAATANIYHLGRAGRQACRVVGHAIPPLLPGRIVREARVVLVDTPTSTVLERLDGGALFHAGAPPHLAGVYEPPVLDGLRELARATADAANARGRHPC